MIVKVKHLESWKDRHGNHQLYFRNRNKKGRRIPLRGPVGSPVRLQPVNATHSLNFSAGVANSSVLRGRSLSCRATLFK
jgi:hypothetical protein